MNRITQPLHDEHQDLFPHIEFLRTVADKIGEEPRSELRREVDEAYQFLAHHLLVHAQAEDQALYPVVANALGSPHAVDTMRRDHVEIAKLIEELGILKADLASETEMNDLQVKDLRRILYGLHTLVKVHFTKEEEVYLPILDEKLSPEEGKKMYADMEAAAAEASKQVR